MTSQTLTNRRDTRPPNFALRPTAGVRRVPASGERERWTAQIAAQRHTGREEII